MGLQKNAGNVSQEDLNKVQSSSRSFMLRRVIGFWRGMSLICGCMIGAGIFVAPNGVIAASNGSIALCFAMWICGGIIACFSALCFCELTTSLKECGGTFTSINIAYGPKVGFIYIWMSIVAPMSDTSMLLTFGKYATELFGRCSNNSLSAKLFAVSLLMICVYLNAVSVRNSLKFQMVCTASKFIAMAIIIFTGIGMLISGNSVGRENFSNIFDPVPLNTLDWRKFTLGFYQVMWPYFGWNILSFICEEMPNAERDMPRATITAVGTVTIAYLAINVGFLSVLTPEEIISSKAVAATFSSKLFGRFYWVLPGLICLCIIGSFFTDVLAYTRTNFAAARRGLLPEVFAMAHIHSHAPCLSVVVSYTLPIILIFVGDIDSMIEALGFITWTFFGLSAFSVLLLRRRYPDLHRPFKVPMVIPALSALISIFFVVSPIIRNPTPMYFYSIVFFGVGGVVYYVFLHLQWRLPGADRMTIFCQKLFQIAITDWECTLDKQNETLNNFHSASAT